MNKGNTVFHAKYGKGEILEVIESFESLENCYVVKFDVGIKEIFESHLKPEKQDSINPNEKHGNIDKNSKDYFQITAKDLIRWEGENQRFKERNKHLQEIAADYQQMIQKVREENQALKTQLTRVNSIIDPLKEENKELFERNQYLLKLWGREKMKNMELEIENSKLKEKTDLSSKVKYFYVY